MALQPCPSCGEVEFTWHLDDDSPLTQWGCGACQYTATEDESLEHACPSCGVAKSCSVLQGADGEYRWCHRCGKNPE